jgi:hypothetical protein
MSVGPCAAITRIIDIDLPRPRDLTNPKVAHLFNEIEALLAAPDETLTDPRLEVPH